MCFLHSGLCPEMITYREKLRVDARVEEVECFCIQRFNCCLKGTVEYVLPHVGCAMYHECDTLQHISGWECCEE